MTPPETQKIEAELRLTLDPVQRKELRRDLLGAWWPISGVPEPTAQLCRAHAALRRQAKKVYSLATDGGDRAAVYAQIIEMLDEVTPVAEFRRGEGRPANLTFITTIIRVGKVYTKWTGKKPGVSQRPDTNEPGGPFFRFVLAYLEVFTPPIGQPIGHEALATAIKRALRLGRKYEAQGLKF